MGATTLIHSSGRRGPIDDWSYSSARVVSLTTMWSVVRMFHCMLGAIKYAAKEEHFAVVAGAAIFQSAG